MDEIKREYGATQATLLREVFDIPVKAMKVSIDMKPRVRERLSDREYNSLFAANAVDYAAAERERTKDAYVTAELELAEAVQLRVEAIEEYLQPEAADSAALAQLTVMNESQIMDFADSATAGAEDSLKLALAVARQRDLEMAQHHIAGLMAEDEWPELLGELFEAQSLRDPEDAGEMFESLAEPETSKELFLGGPQSAQNITGRVAGR